MEDRACLCKPPLTLGFPQGTLFSESTTSKTVQRSMPRDRRSRSPRRPDHDTDKRQKDTINDGKDTQARSRSRSLVRDTGSPVRKRRRDDSMSRSRSRSREPRRKHRSRSRVRDKGEKRRRARSISSSSDSSEGRRKEHRKDKNRDGKRSKSKERRKEKRREKKEKKEKVCSALHTQMIFNINTEKEGERKYTTLGKVWDNIRCGVRQFIYFFSSNVPIYFN
jgi:hypothetical protein